MSSDRNKESRSVRIMNVSTQTIPIQLTTEGVDFYNGQQQMRLKANQHITLDEKYLIPGQVDNLASRSMLRVTRLS